MDLKNLFDKGKKIVDERGGVDSLKADAEELKKIASGKGSMADKAKEAAAALKDPGARGGERNPGGKHGPGGKHQPGANQGSGPKHQPGADQQRQGKHQGGGNQP